MEHQLPAKWQPTATVTAEPWGFGRKHELKWREAELRRAINEVYKNDWFRMKVAGLLVNGPEAWCKPNFTADRFTRKS